MSESNGKSKGLIFDGRVKYTVPFEFNRAEDRKVVKPAANRFMARPTTNIFALNLLCNRYVKAPRAAHTMMLSVNPKNRLPNS
jgi:hypothetical protein